MPENKVVALDIEAWAGLDVELVYFDKPVVIREDNPVVQFCLKSFKLHGSRFFNRKYPDMILIEDHTDWDFFCPSGQNHANFLSEHGFLVWDRNPEYLDEGTEKIWYHPNVLSLQVVQKRNFDQYNALINNILFFEYLHIRKGFLKEINPRKNDDEIRKIIQENMKIFYIRYGL